MQPRVELYASVGRFITFWEKKEERRKNIVKFLKCVLTTNALQQITCIEEKLVYFENILQVRTVVSHQILLVKLKKHNQPKPICICINPNPISSN